MGTTATLRLDEIEKAIIEDYASSKGMTMSEFMKKVVLDYIEDESLIPEEDIIITLTHNGYIKRVNNDTYRVQNRGGVGIKGISVNLKPHKRAFFCYAPDDLSQIVACLKEFKLNLVSLKFIHTKADKPANLALFEVRNNSNSKLKILPPLVMSENGSHTKEAIEIFKKADTKSVDYQGLA